MLFDVVHYNVPGYVRPFEAKAGGCWDDGSIWYTFDSEDEARSKADQLRSAYGPRQSFVVERH